MRWKSWISLILAAFMSFPGTATAPPPQREESAVWNAQVSYTVKFSSPRYGDGYQKQTFTAMYQIDKSGAPINGNILFSDEGRLKGEFPGGQWWEGMKKCESTEWSVTDSHIFKAPEELSPGNEAGIRGVALPVVLGPHISGNRRFVSGESGIVVSVRGFYPNAMTGPCEDDCGKRCNHDVEVDINSGPTAGSGFKVVEGSPPESPPEIEISPEQEAQEEAQWEARVKAWLKKPSKEKDEEFQQEVEKWSIAEMQRSGMIELKGNVYQGSRQWTESNPVKLITITHTLTWHFSLIPEGVEAVMWVDVKEYEEWLPIAGENEDKPGNKLDVKVVLQKRGKPDEKPQRTAIFKFELLDVSKEPGVCMNWPPKEKAKETFDLKIDSEENKHLEIVTGDGQSAASKEGRKEEGITITSYDYGAYGKLKVVSILDDGSQVVAHLKDKPDQTFLLIPRDDNSNHIADKWEKEMGVEGMASDSDEDNKPPGDRRCFEGDGLSLYEEYRGFMVKGQHTRTDPNRTDPNRKDLFIYSKVPHDSAGIDRFYIASGIKVHRVDDKELGSDRVINFNSSKDTHVVDQHGLVMVETSLDEGIAGKSPIGPPKYVDKVQIKKDYLNNESPNRGDALMVTIAHELGHAVGIQHHGTGDYKREFRRGELPCVISDGELLWVAVQNGQHSGVENCIMRYRSATVVERGGKFECYSGGAQKELFCNAKGPNPLVGEATNGNCMRQICLSDREFK